MRVYIASSWKNERMVYAIACNLRGHGHEVDCFCDESTGRYIFHWSEILNSPDKSKGELNAITFLEDKRSQKAFKEDRKWLDWCECLILVLPAGNSSHLEAGYVKGQGKKLVIQAPNGFIPGEFDVMYGFADFMTEHSKELFQYLGGQE